MLHKYKKENARVDLDMSTKEFSRLMLKIEIQHNILRILCIPIRNFKF